VCRSRGQPGANLIKDEPMNVVVDHPAQPFRYNGEYTLFPVVSSQPTFLPWRTSVVINGLEVQMEIDTGASVTLVSEATFDTLKTSTTIPPLEPASIKLRTYTGEEIRTLGTIPVTVEKDGQKVTLPLLVVAGTGPNLIGRNWLAELRLDWREINAISECHSLTPILDRNEAVFQPGLRIFKPNCMWTQMLDLCSSKPAQCHMHLDRRWNKNWRDYKTKMLSCLFHTQNGLHPLYL